MKKMEILRIQKELLHDFSEFRICNGLMLLPIVDGLLRGVIFEGSSFDKYSFRITAFVQPLFVPSRYLSLTLPEPIRKANGADRWSVLDGDLKALLVRAFREQAVSYFGRIQNIADFITALSQQDATIRSQEKLAYAFVKSGDVESALSVFSRIRSMADQDIAWQKEIAHQADSISTMLRQDIELANTKIEEWEAHTLENIKLNITCLSN